MVKKYISLCLLVWMSLSVYAQGPPARLNKIQSDVAYVVDDTAAYRLSSDQPDKALEAARDILMMPETTFSRAQKVLFFRKLSVMFEDSGHFKEALSCLKTADSLQNLKDTLPVRKPSEHTASNRWSVYLFYMMVLIFLLLLVYVFYGIKGRTMQLKKQQYEREDLMNEHDNLREELEEKINEENRDLQQQLDALKEKELSLKTALQKVEKASYLRNAFIANLGFDVRTPLNSIIGFANMLETDLAVQENKELYGFAANIEESGNRLLKLLNNVIDLSSLEAHAMNIKQKPVSLVVVIEKVFQRYTEQAKDKGLVYKMKAESDLPPVLADDKALEKVLEQITDNAVKYTEDGFVTLSAYYLPEKEMDVVEIKDTGPGLDVKHRQMVFEGLEVSSTFSTGTGIGLRLAHDLLQMMRGKMDISSSPGEGTVVQVYIPCSEKAVESVAEVSAPEASPAEEAAMIEPQEALDLFVLEDDRMNRLILEKMLKKLGTVELAVDGSDCLKKVDQAAAKGHFYQVMLFDINLPDDWDGVKLMKEIRGHYPEYKNIPFIAQTAYAMEGDKERFLAEGFDSYLSKPIDQNELYAVVRQQLNIYKNKEKPDA